MRSGVGRSASLMKGLGQFRTSLGGRWLALEQGREDCVVVVGLVGGAFWKEEALCPFCILFA